MTKDTNIPPFMEESMKAFKDFKFPGNNMQDMMAMYKKNIELMNTTQQIAIEATKAMMELQRNFMQSAFEEWSDQMKTAASKGSFDDPAQKAKKAMDDTVEHMKELNTIVEKSNEKIKDSFQKRIKESIDETTNLGKKK
jgi:hypothetical protein